MCEWLRNIVGKNGLRLHQNEIAKLMIRCGQFGNAMPGGGGGGEALFHARDSIEELAATGAMESIAVVDVDPYSPVFIYIYIYIIY